MDGTYDFDATVRSEMAGITFLVLVEAKRHKDPIRREHVQVLHSKLQSVGPQKAVMISTAPYQSGAVTYARTHGIALVTVTGGRFTYQTKAAMDVPYPIREQAADWFGLPTFVGHCYGGSENSDAIQITTMSVKLASPDRSRGSGVIGAYKHGSACPAWETWACRRFKWSRRKALRR